MRQTCMYASSPHMLEEHGCGSATEPALVYLHPCVKARDRWAREARGRVMHLWKLLAMGSSTLRA